LPDHRGISVSLAQLVSNAVSERPCLRLNSAKNATLVADITVAKLYSFKTITRLRAIALVG
jgi:hypothetical protein